MNTKLALEKLVSDAIAQLSVKVQIKDIFNVYF